MRVVVTGSAGFLGAEVVQRLCGAGHDVIGIDRRCENHSPRFIHHDLLWSYLPHLPPFDVCVHLASSVGGFLRNATDHGQVANEIALLRAVRELCVRGSCHHLIYASSINVFESHHHPTEGRLVVLPQRTPYARAKAAAEEFVQRNFPNFVIFRPTNLFGHGQQTHSRVEGESHVIPDLLRKIATAPTVAVLGDGKQVRNFLHVSDAAGFIVHAIDTYSHGWFNLRSDIHLTIGELAERLLAAHASEKSIALRREFLRYEPRPLALFQMDAAPRLGWSPRVHLLESGLGLTA